MDIGSVMATLQQELPEPTDITIVPRTTPPGLAIPVTQLVAVSTLLHTHPDLYIDYLACITALDNGPSLGTLELIYQLYSIPYDFQLMLKVVVARNNPDEAMPTVPSISSIWKGANWHEREAYDLIGIQFAGHPDLRRILLPEDWIGHPLRLDYTYPTAYHGMQTE